MPVLLSEHPTVLRVVRQPLRPTIDDAVVTVVEPLLGRLQLFRREQLASSHAPESVPECVSGNEFTVFLAHKQYVGPSGYFVQLRIADWSSTTRWSSTSG